MTLLRLKQGKALGLRRCHFLLGLRPLPAPRYPLRRRVAAREAIAQAGPSSTDLKTPFQDGPPTSWALAMG